MMKKWWMKNEMTKRNDNDMKNEKWNNETWKVMIIMKKMIMIVMT